MKTIKFVALSIAGFVLSVSQPVVADDAIHVTPAGHVGFGTNTPGSQVEVTGSDPLGGIDNTTALYVKNNSETAAGRVVFGLENNGTTRFSINNTSAADARWVFSVGGTTSFRISKADTPVVEFEVTPTGDVNAQGTFNTLSDRNSKMDIETLNSKAILDSVVSLPLSSWSYKDEPGVSHIGPMAQDFYSAFKLGSSNKSIASIDASGIALVAIQGLYKELEEKEMRIQALEKKIEAQELMMSRIDALENIAVNMMSLQQKSGTTTAALNNN